ncbi:EutB-domain-containing protein [Gonapodya prolifera JEL478]|uniref:EutB-domain-containing protein n=1 Tax=Gonapodya prolifera (strain JEL478) TaxID=1344416 RepID=A0A139AGE9_GONPJ|nr:EutB-domain-containing protein [Gonapodya prolifera JEL478]|eukprot:KXS15867.1 EutB-domain-containing protein [Gonapodya prolifera JEL478]
MSAFESQPFVSTGSTSAGAPSLDPYRSTAALKLTWGRANEFKEGDEAIGVAALNDDERMEARGIIASMRLADIQSSLFVQDEVSTFIESFVDREIAKSISSWTFGELKQFLLDKSEDEIKAIMPGLRSEVVAGVIKLMSSDELIAVSSKIYNNAPGSTLGARGQLGSRIQPNSPDDDPTEILYSVLEGLSYGCGDMVLGINPVNGDRVSVARLEATLKDVVQTFQAEDTLKWCVLAHIKDQSAVEDTYGPAILSTLFQSLGGTSSLLSTFDTSVPNLVDLCCRPQAPPNLYFETGQGSAFTNGADHGVDMVTLECRNYGLARALTKKAGKWTMVNTVAGFIGPEVFRTSAQLLRACLEDLCAGKLHGLIMGLDVCSTYHMGVEIDELDDIQESILPAGPGFYMAVAGKSDPMLSYLTTDFRDIARLRYKHSMGLSPSLISLLSSLGTADPTTNTLTRPGDTEHMYVQYRRRKGDTRPETEIRAEARKQLDEFQKRGLDLGYGCVEGFRPPPAIDGPKRDIYHAAKRAIYERLPEPFVDELRRFRFDGDGGDGGFPGAGGRCEYVLKPVTGEHLDEAAAQILKRRGGQLAQTVAEMEGNPPTNLVQVVVSDGLNSDSVAAPGHLFPFLRELESSLRAAPAAAGAEATASTPPPPTRGAGVVHTFVPTLVVVENARVRAGYAAGRDIVATLVSSAAEYATTSAHGTLRLPRFFTTVHIIGERPGNGQNTFSAYVACVTLEQWMAGEVDHGVVALVSGVSATAMRPETAAREVAQVVRRKVAQGGGAGGKGKSVA